MKASQEACLGEPARVNDVHSALNSTNVFLHTPTTRDQISELVVTAASAGRSIAICGGRHAMGGQQFAESQLLIDMRSMNRVLSLDLEKGLVRVEAGIEWPELIRAIQFLQQDLPPIRPRWAIAQKQTGADALSLGGALAANVHGRGLLMGPIAGDVEEFTLIDAHGAANVCTRTHNPDLFALAIGGHGLFGVIVEVVLRLVPRRTLRRVVRVIDIQEAIPAAERRISQGFLYGDFQFDIDHSSPDFLTKGVFSGYCPVEHDPAPTEDKLVLSRANWLDLLTMAHTDKTRAFTKYAQHYLATDGQLYYTDTHQLSEYIDQYHVEVDRRTAAPHKGSEIITELYVPPERLVEFLQSSSRLLGERQTQVIYGTIRLIQPDTTTVLAWARRRYACVIFNLHVDHVPAALARVADTFRILIDLAAELDGSFYLTYHRYATPAQIERCYPRVREFFAAKKRFDSRGVFQSDWYRHYAPHFEQAER